MHSSSKPSTWTLIPWWLKSSIACSCSSDRYVLLRLLCLINSRMQLYIATWCVVSCALPCNALKSLILASGCLPTSQLWGPMNSGIAYDYKLRGQPDQHRKGGLCRQQRCFPDAEWGLGDWALWFRSREYDAPRWLLVAGSCECDSRRSNRPWGWFYMLVHVSQQNTVARLRSDECVRPNQTSTASSDSWRQHLPPSQHLSCGWYQPASNSFRSASCTATKFKHLIPRLSFASSQVHQQNAF